MTSKCKELCKHGDYVFKFSSDRADFSLARENCTNNGGWLASDLNRGAYETINKCCAQRKNYYIGLVDVTRNQCKSNYDLPFKWIESGNCTDGSPLTNITLEKTKQCVSISFSNSSFPNVQKRNCNRTRFYICQTKIFPNATPATQLIKFTTNKQIEVSLYETTLTTSSKVNNGDAAFLIPIVVGAVVFILLAALISLYIFLYKRGCLKRFPNSNERTTVTNKEIKNNPLYNG